jgi:TetR/AcrR family transcriptional regulator
VTGVTPADLRSRVFDVIRAQIDERVGAGRMHAIDPGQFVVNLLALCLFPFAAKPMLTTLLDLDEAGFTRFIDRRGKELAPFFLRALRP